MLVTRSDRGEVSIVQSNTSTLSPTDQAYGEWQLAYDYFNGRLFADRLPHCLITLTRKDRTLGYFAPERFSKIGGTLAHEIALNPQYLELQGDYLALSTLVHEQAHVFRHEFGPLNKNGKAGSRGYHDRCWAETMLGVGLVPSDTGLPGGKQTGQSMSHYVAPGGPFDLACRELLLTGFKISWRDSLFRSDETDGDDDQASAHDRRKSKRVQPGAGTRTKFSCLNCGLNAWARPSARLGCIACSTLMTPQKEGNSQ